MYRNKDFYYFKTKKKIKFQRFWMAKIEIKEETIEIKSEKIWAYN